jgi:hypothetical protein
MNISHAAAQRRSGRRKDRILDFLKSFAASLRRRVKNIA